ncbi:siderophore-interacting protein [Paraflavitalea sp. CAU 1676]|uniref:siderophore-interacting protein n=1 Tax=Paraflavitalea sp. CAU 1676 TaxID=3032598 RepID=UPI0023D9C930|nr:siderophore-interacting protein [Paraflavitalea sp. CAU 1676]MDF2188249.1 siderophore-interacting protein [Paraflavitalea sp. CAU 1676]
MCQIPKWLADTMTSVANPWLRNAVVTHTSMVSDELKLITFKGDFDHENFLPGKTVQFRVDESNFRQYTLSAFNKKDSTCSVLFYLHGKGPGSEWAANLRTGQPVKFRAGEATLRYNDEAKHHFFFGDETSLGLFNWYKTTALACSHEYFGVLELHPQHEGALSSLKIMVDNVHSLADAPAVNAIDWMEDMHPDCWAAWKGATFYLTGRGLSINRFRKYLLGKGVDAVQIRTDAYWADGKTGL